MGLTSRILEKLKPREQRINNILWEMLQEISEAYSDPTFGPNVKKGLGICETVGSAIQAHKMIWTPIDPKIELVYSELEYISQKIKPKDYE